MWFSKVGQRNCVNILIYNVKHCPIAIDLREAVFSSWIVMAPINQK
jgi:hypothetical protein